MSVYFIGGGDLIKIGQSIDPESRMHDLQAGSPVRLELLAVRPGGEREERALHRQFKDTRRHGEWFARSESLLALIEEIRACASAMKLSPPTITSHVVKYKAKKPVTKTATRPIGLSKGPPQKSANAYRDAVRSLLEKLAGVGPEMVSRWMKGIPIPPEYHERIVDTAIDLRIPLARVQDRFKKYATYGSMMDRERSVEQ